MFDICDDEFIRGNVPMTKHEIRILTLAKAQIKPSDVVIDIGAGTGSLSIESAKIARQVFAIEKNSEAIELIEQNADKFSVDNIVIINAEAPNGLKAINNVDVVLIGGSGGNLFEILEVVNKKLKSGGRIVINCITIQTISVALDWFKSHSDYKYDAVQVQVSRLEQIKQNDLFKALNPIYIVAAIKN